MEKIKNIKDLIDSEVLSNRILGLMFHKRLNPLEKKNFNLLSVERFEIPAIKDSHQDCWRGAYSFNVPSKNGYVRLTFGKNYSKYHDVYSEYVWLGLVEYLVIDSNFKAKISLTLPLKKKGVYSYYNTPTYLKKIKEDCIYYNKIKHLWNKYISVKESNKKEVVLKILNYLNNI